MILEEKKIWIMEDEQKIGDTLKFGLTENGYYVEVAYNGSIGYRLFETHNFNLYQIDFEVSLKLYNFPFIMGRPSKPITVTESLAELKGLHKQSASHLKPQDTNAHLKQTI